jgi:DNA repair exonuclease SbcCD ATPase subunit
MIIFKKIKFKNFGSFGNKFTEIDLTKSTTTLVCGTNGSGKSFALLDSITFALFGKPFRKINIPQLQNSINTKDCSVELFFEIGSEQYRIKRGLGPKVFEIYKNDKLINQDAKTSDYQDVLEQQIIKMNYKTFTQVVILGSSSFVPFMQLTAADRRSVIENILDINVFTNMNILLKGKINLAKENLKDLSNKIEIHTQKIEYQKKIIDKSYGITLVEFENITKEIEKDIEKKSTIQQQIKILSDTILNIDDNLLDTLEQENVKLQKFLAQISLKISNSTEDKDFYETQKNCSKCKGEITEETKQKSLQEIDKNLQQFSEASQTFEVKIKENNEKIKELKNQIKNNNTIKDQIKDLNNQITIIDISIDHKNKKIQQTDQDKIIIEKEKNILNDLSIELNMMIQEKDQKKEEYIQFEQVYDILKDGGVKSKIIKHYLPAMNKNINKYLKTMGFFVQFYLDENFNETIKSRNRDEFSYMNFSEGEKMRIDLSLLLAWREIAKLKNSVNCNLLILDEVFDSSLDSFGTDEVMKLLNTLGVNSNVFVISHKADQIADKFSNVIHFEKKNNFSKMS